MFRDMLLPAGLDSPASDLVKDFYSPALASSISYDRVSGYFNSGGLLAAAAGLADFINQNGVIRIVVGMVLENRDWDAIVGNRVTNDRVSSMIDEKILSAIDVEKTGLDVLAALVSTGRLQVRVALMREKDQGIFHSKIGVMYDGNGDSISFSGSANETHAGWSKNAESISIFRSWADTSHHLSIVKSFQTTWSGTGKIKSVPVSSVVRLALSESELSKQGVGLLSLSDLVLLAAEAWINEGESKESLRNNLEFEAVRVLSSTPASILPSEIVTKNTFKFSELMAAAKTLIAG